MKHLRVRISIHLNNNHALSHQELENLKPLIARGVAQSLPETIAVDTIEVTRIRDAEQPVEAAAQ
jgi:hypothetical protein